MRNVFSPVENPTGSAPCAAVDGTEGTWGSGAEAGKRRTHTATSASHSPQSGQVCVFFCLIHILIKILNHSSRRHRGWGYGTVNELPPSIETLPVSSSRPCALSRRGKVLLCSLPEDTIHPACRLLLSHLLSCSFAFRTLQWMSRLC